MKAPGTWIWRAGLVSAATAVVGTAAVVGCSERDRLTFPTVADDIGPVTSIDRPGVAETTIVAGPQFVLNGRTVDPDGILAVNFFVGGGSDHTPPFTAAGDSVRFGLPITTAGHRGDTLDVEIYGVDSAGNRGASAFRRLFVR